MAFSDDEKTIHDGQPREMYRFTLSGGDVADYFYTDYDEDILFLGNTYTSIPIQRSGISAVATTDPSELIVSMPHNTALVDELMLKLPPREVKLTLQRYHGNPSNAQQIWTGQVRSCQINGAVASLRVPSKMMETLEAPVPAAAAQTMCNHVLYDSRCSVVRASFTVSSTILTIDSNDPRIVTMAASPSLGADQTYRGGEIERTSDGERRLIVDQTGQVLTLARAFRNLLVSDACDVSQGCDHLVATCNTKFDNLVNFGGMPHIPAEDLFRYGVQGL